MTPNPLTDRRGMTLMETLIVIGIMTIVMVVVSQILVVNNQMVANALARVDADSGAALAVRRIAELTRGAESVLASQDVNGTTYASDADTLVLRLPAIDSAGDLIVDTYDYVAFYRDTTETTEIWTDTDAASGSVRQDGQKLLTAYNDTMVFRYDDPDVEAATRVSAYLVNSRISRGRTVSADAWVSLFLRNKE